MGKKRKIISFFLLLLTFLLPVGSVYASSFSQSVVSAVKGVYLYDDAGLLDDDQRERLSEHLKKCGQETGCGIYAVTSSEPGGRTGDRYLEDFYDNGFDTGQIDTDAVLIYLDMENRYVNVQAYGKAQNRITDGVCDKIIDAIYDDLKAGYYYNVIEVYADEAVDYLNYVPIYLRAWVQLIAALIIGGIAVSAMAVKSGGVMTVNADTYLDSRYSGIRARRDDYIRTSVTKRKKPKPSEGGGSSGGGHVSSGGHSHSSGGRNF